MPEFSGARDWCLSRLLVAIKREALDDLRDKFLTRLDYGTRLGRGFPPPSNAGHRDNVYSDAAVRPKMKAKEVLAVHNRLRAEHLVHVWRPGQKMGAEE